MIEISPSAQEYLRELLAKQGDGDVSIRVFVAQPGTPQAETCIAYCQPGEEQEGFFWSGRCICTAFCCTLKVRARAGGAGEANPGSDGRSASQVM